MAGKGVIGARAAATCFTGTCSPIDPQEEAGDCGPGLMSEDVARWPFPELRPPAGNEGEEDEQPVARGMCPGGLDNVSATILDAPATCWMSLVYSAM